MRRLVLLATVLGFAAGQVVFADHASAALTRVLAAQGRQAKHADTTCFSPYYATITNTCSTTRNWDMVLPTTQGVNAATQTINIKFKEFGGSSCRATGMARTPEDGIWTGSTNGMTVNGEAHLQVYVPSGGALFITCSIWSDERLDSVQYQH
jgi:hypothetical protein